MLHIIHKLTCFLYRGIFNTFSPLTTLPTGHTAKNRLTASRIHKPSADKRAQIRADAAETVSDSRSCYLLSSPVSYTNKLANQLRCNVIKNINIRSRRQQAGYLASTEKKLFVHGVCVQDARGFYSFQCNLGPLSAVKNTDI